MQTCIVNWHAAVRKCVFVCLDSNELLQDLYPYKLTDQFYPDSRKRFCLIILLFFARYDFSYSCLLQVGAGLKNTDSCSESPVVKRRHLIFHFCCCWIFLRISAVQCACQSRRVILQVWECCMVSYCKDQRKVVKSNSFGLITHKLMLYPQCSNCNIRKSFRLKEWYVHILWGLSAGTCNSKMFC